MSGVTSSAAPTSGQKLSMLAAKSGFVIPKNKLSGSLVPIFKGAKIHGTSGATNEESSKKIQRKTKWGPDLTQDAAVRRGRAIALQIRVDQITQQLKSRKLEVGDTQDSSLLAENPDQSYSDTQIDNKKSEMLELEKLEAIGEILRLDPSYKPPPGFKALLKEASVPLPVKEYPGFNFAGLVYGPEGDNQKRLEKETGTKIQIHGIKADTGKKDEIKPGNDVQCTYEEMRVIISADSFEKVDAAVSIIELLITSVTGNLAAASTTAISVSGDNSNVLSQSKDYPPSHPVSLAMENQVLVQHVAGVTEMPGDHFQYSGTWHSAAPSHIFASGNVATRSGFARPLHFPSQSINSSNMASTFGAQPAPVAGFNSFIPNQPIVSLQAQPTRENLQHSHMTQASPLGHIPSSPSIISPQTPSAPTNASLSFPVNVSQPAPIGQLQTLVPSMPQPMYGISPAPVPDWLLTPLGVSSGQGGVSLGLSNMGKMAPSVVSGPRPVSLHLQDVAFKPPRSASFPPHQARIPPGLPPSLGPMQPTIPAPTHSSVNHLPGSVSFPSPKLPSSLPPSQQSGIPNSASGITSYHTSVKPPVLTASNSGNFTFQPQRPNADFQVVSRPNSATQAGIKEQFSGPRPPSFGFAVPDQPASQIFPRTQIPNQVDQTQAPVYAIPFGGRPSVVSITPRHDAFPYAGQPAPRSQVPQMGMRNSFAPPQMPNLPSPGIPRAGSMHIRQNYPAQRWPDIPLPSNQKFGNNHSMASGKPVYPADQIYDPFSPTSVAPPQQKNDPAK